MGSVAVAQPEGSRWALTSQACSGDAFSRDETPLIVEGFSLRWFDTDCKVVSNYRVKDTLFLQAQCVGAGRTTTIPVMLEPNGARLRVGWNREPVREMRRCHWTAALGYHWSDAGESPSPVTTKSR
jgi:hypothetical protein